MGLNNLHRLCATNAVLMFLILATSSSIEIPDKLKGKGNLGYKLKACAERGSVMAIECYRALMPDGINKKCVKITNLRDGYCDCDCTSDLDEPVCARNESPNAQNCDDNADEECDEGSFSCAPGKCLKNELYEDGKLDCEWHCVEPNDDINATRTHCRQHRAVEIKRMHNAFQQLSAETSRNRVRSKCQELSKREIPFDCMMEEFQSDLVVLGQCEQIEKIVKDCKDEFYADEDWFKYLPEN